MFVRCVCMHALVKAVGGCSLASTISPPYSLKTGSLTPNLRGSARLGWQWEITGAYMELKTQSGPPSCFSHRWSHLLHHLRSPETADSSVSWKSIRIKFAHWVHLRPTSPLQGFFVILTLSFTVNSTPDSNMYLIVCVVGFFVFCFFLLFGGLPPAPK